MESKKPDINKPLVLIQCEEGQVYNVMTTDPGMQIYVTDVPSSLWKLSFMNSDPMEFSYEVVTKEEMEKELIRGEGQLDLPFMSGA